LKENISSFVADYHSRLESNAMPWVTPSLKTLGAGAALNIPLYFTQLLINGEDLVEKAVELAPNKPVVRFFLSQLNEIYTVPSSESTSWWLSSAAS
jgi:hypothetical protein